MSQTQFDLTEPTSISVARAVAAPTDEIHKGGKGYRNLECIYLSNTFVTNLRIPLALRYIYRNCADKCTPSGEKKNTKLNETAKHSA